MELYRNKFRDVHGYLEGKSDAIDPVSADIAYDYKKNFLKHFIAISPQQIDSRMGGDRYYVTRKYDGEYAIIFYESGEAVTVNRSGRVRLGLPCIEEAAAMLEKAGVRQAIIPAEIYVDEERSHRTRVNDLVSALANPERTGNLKLAAFDILQVNNKPYRPVNYGETVGMLRELFSGGRRIHAVDMEEAISNEQVREIYDRWVGKEGSEGLVVRSGMPFIFKVKPRHSLDTVVVGFTEGSGNQKGQVRTYLLAMMPKKGRYQVVGRIGGGMSAELKKKMFEEFSTRIVESEFIDTDSNHVAFRMIQPETVLEISVNDVIYETGSGPVTNHILEFTDGQYRINSIVEGMSFIAPIYERFREDKKADHYDVRLSQIGDFSSFDRGPGDRTPRVDVKDLPKSELLFRVVYEKRTGSKVMLQKYMVWKTNKEESGDFPAYVFHYTNFSSERQNPLVREVRISDSYDQIMELQYNTLQKNVKKGWERVGGSEFFAEAAAKPKKSAKVRKTELKGAER